MLARQFGRGGDDDKERGTKGQRLSGSLDCSLLVAYRVFQKSFSQVASMKWSNVPPHS